nr:hypothetical protein [Angustibacter aerolatus]
MHPVTRATTRITTDVGRRAALARLLAALGAVVALVVTTTWPCLGGHAQPASRTADP